jgi:hypothetical protein
VTENVKKFLDFRCNKARLSCFGWAAVHPYVLVSVGQQCILMSWVSHVRLCVWDHESAIGRARTPACDWTHIPAISIAIAGVIGKLSGWCSVAEQLWALMDHPQQCILHYTAPSHKKK